MLVCWTAEKLYVSHYNPLSHRNRIAATSFKQCLEFEKLANVLMARRQPVERGPSVAEARLQQSVLGGKSVAVALGEVRGMTQQQSEGCK